MSRTSRILLTLLVLLPIVCGWWVFTMRRESTITQNQLYTHNLCLEEIRKDDDSRRNVSLGFVERWGLTWTYQGRWEEDANGEVGSIVCEASYDGWNAYTPTITLRSMWAR